MAVAQNMKSAMGPVISLASLERIIGVMGKTKGTVVAGGERMAGLSELDGTDFSIGNFFPPTVVTNIETTDELWIEEVFGPVVVVKQFKVGPISVFRSLLLIVLYRLRLKVSHWPMIASTAWGQEYGLRIYREHTEYPPSCRLVCVGSILITAMIPVLRGADSN